MYKTFKLLTFTLNTSGGAAEVIEAMTKEVDGVVVPCTKEEALVKLYNKISSVGGNKATQAIKVMLFDAEGGMIKSEELIKPITE